MTIRANRFAFDGRFFVAFKRYSRISGDGRRTRTFKMKIHEARKTQRLATFSRSDATRTLSVVNSY